MNMDKLAKETEDAVQRWLAHIDSNRTEDAAANTLRNLASLVKIVEEPTAAAKDKQFALTKITTS